MAAPPVLDELLAWPGRATRALVDLDVLHANAVALRGFLGDVELMAVVKADGYGHGAVMVAREAVRGGATWLGVATVAEGAELRDAGLSVPTLVLGPIHPSELAAACASGLDVTVGDETLAEAVAAVAAAGAPLPRLHVEVDTGMHRYGLTPGDALGFLERIESVRPGAVVAMWSHLASAEEEEGSVTRRQLAAFDDVARAALSVRPDLAVHVANSAGIVAGHAGSTRVARAGIALYGCGIPPWLEGRVELAQAMSIVSRVVRLDNLRPGDAVSYGGTYVAAEPERVALVPIGYADGYPRSLSNAGLMSIGGHAAPVRGRVCMDQTVVGDVPTPVAVGDWVGVAGPALGGQSWDAVAARAGTISYELLTSVGRRVARLYHRSGRLVAVRDERGRHSILDAGHDDAPPGEPGGA